MRYYYLMLLIFFFLSSCYIEPDPPLLRIRNVDTFDYDKIIVRDIDFGALSIGATTDYEVFENLYRFDFIQVVINGDTCRADPFSFEGEELYETGEFRYDLWTVHDTLLNPCLVRIDFVEE